MVDVTCSQPVYSPQEIVQAIWGWTGSTWTPKGFNYFHLYPSSMVTFVDTNGNGNTNLFEIICSDTSHNPAWVDPLLVTDRGMVVQKDLAVGGFISTNQGGVCIGHGWNTSTDLPKIVLIHASPDLYSPGYGTLYLKKRLVVNNQFNDDTEGDLDLGNLTTHGTIKAAYNGISYNSYYGGGGGGSNGGCALDEWGNLCFVGGTSSNSWDIKKYRGGPQLMSVQYSGGIRAHCDLSPIVNNTYACGTGSYAWAGVVTNTIYRRNESSFDSLDDLALAKNYKTKKVIEKNGLEKELVDIESLPHLKGDPTENDPEISNFWDESKVSGFLLGCVKALVYRVEALEKQLKPKTSL